MGKFLFEDCIRGALKNKTRLLVTHQVQYLSECDLIIVLEDGHVKACDTYENLYELGVDIASMLPVRNEVQTQPEEEESSTEPITDQTRGIQGR